MAVWIQLALFVAVTLVSELLRPKPDIENAKPAGDGDFQFPTAEEGRPWPNLWGTVRLSGPNVIWWGDKKQKAIKETIKTGLFSSEDVIVGYRYFVGIQFGLCRGGRFPVDELRRVWIGKDMVYDGGGADSVVTHGGTFTIDDDELFGGDDLGSGGVEATMRLHDGGLSQSPSSYLTPFQTESGQQIAYRGRCYVDPATTAPYLGNSSSIRPWAFELRRTPNPLGLASAAVNGLDANPMNVLYEVLTSVEFPLQIDPALIDDANFTTVGNTLNSEGNGFSMLIDRNEESADTIKRIEDQINGFLHFDISVGKWRVTLARADYDPNTVPELNETNVLEFVEFSRGSWDDTRNEVRVQFSNRDNDYKKAVTPPAQDDANIRIQGGQRVTATFTMGGVKNRTLASNIGWRKLRSLATPLARGKVRCDRSLYETNPGDVLTLTDSDLGFTKLPVRITRVNRGDFGDSVIELDFVQDIFFNAAASGGLAQITLWTPPVDALAAFASDRQRAFEAPRKLLTLDPNTVDANANKIYVSARLTGNEVRYSINVRTNPSTASFSGTPIEIGKVYGFALIGELNGALNAGSTYPFDNLSVVATPDSASEILTALGDPSVLPLVQHGTELTTLLLIDDEFFLVTGAVSQPGNLDFDGVYRGVLDSVQADHASGADVWLLFVGSGMSADEVGDGHHVEVRLAPESQSDELDPLDGGVTPIVFQMQDRAKLPYPPSELSLNGGRFSASASLEGSGSGEDVGIGLSFLRRDFRLADELAQLGVDAAGLSADFPSAQNTRHEVEVVDDPGGSPTTLFTQDLALLTSDDIRRLDILKATGGALPTTLQFKLRSYHDFADLSGARSLQDLEWDFTVTSALTGYFEFGAIDNGDVSAVYTATVTGQYDFTLSSSFSVGNVEYRINGGTWTTLISATNTTGNIPTVNASDTIEVRHLSSDSATEKLLTMAAAGAGQDAFAVLFT